MFVVLSWVKSLDNDAIISVEVSDLCYHSNVCPTCLTIVPMPLTMIKNLPYMVIFSFKLLDL